MVPSFTIPTNFKFVACDSKAHAMKVASDTQMPDTIVTYRETFDRACTISRGGDFVRVVGGEHDGASRFAMNVLTGPTHCRYSFPVNEWIPLSMLQFMGGLMVTGSATVEYGMIANYEQRVRFIKTTNVSSLNHGRLIVGNTGILGTLEYYNANKSMFSVTTEEPEPVIFQTTRYPFNQPLAVVY
jgi:hypothetical protein